MNIFSKTALLSASVALLMTSCSSDADEDRITDQTLSGYFNVVTDLNTGESEIFSGVSYNVVYNYDKMTANIAMSGLKLPGDMSYPTLATGELPWTADNDGWKNISRSNVLLSAINYANVPMVHDFVFNLRDRWFDDDAYACSTVIHFIVNDMYQVVSIPRQTAVWGLTTVKYLNGFSGTYTTDDSVYVIEIDPETGLANLTINDFSLSDEMEILAVVIKDIPFTIDKTGTLTLTKDEASATIFGAPDPAATKMVVKDLKMTVKGGSVDASYRITENNQTYDVTVKG